MLKKYFGIGGVLFLILSLSSMLIAADSTKVIIDNFTLEDYTGKQHSLTDYKDSKAIVVMFIATQCPVSNDYNVRMAQLHKDYKSKGIIFLGINSNKQEDIAEIKKHAGKNKFKFAVLKDHNNVIADKFGASFTPEIFVLNPELEVVYHGRIDDSRRVGDVKTHDLRNTLDEILAGKAVTVAKTKAFGCTIKRVEK